MTDGDAQLGDEGRRRGGDLRIGHFFADWGVESERLAAYGDVHRFTIDPKPNEFVDETTQIDLVEEEPDIEGQLDFGLWHPECYKWTQRSAEDAENQIPRVRELADRYCKEYVIENKPKAPLEAPPGGSKIVLDGSMFGLAVEYKRAFECSYEVTQPPRQPNWAPEHRVENTRPRQYWKAVKGYVGDYEAKPFITNALPAAYVDHLIRPILDGYEGRPTSQSDLTEVGARAE